MNLAELLWWLFAALAIGGGAGMVAGRNPMASLLSLVLTLFSLAVLFILMGAHFIGAIQVIVYAGAIMVLFLFVIMLLNLGHDYRGDLRGVAWIAGGSLLAGLMGYLISDTFVDIRGLVVPGQGMLPEAAVAEHGAIGAIGAPLFREYLVGFEVASLLLLAAIIGAILLAKRRV